tara:strand:+ start:153 stop:614 length:462 start_codon:yes stop_codon:yes gene_type:complete
VCAKMSFTGEFYNIIDQKNRLSIPAKYRKALDLSNDKTFVLTRGFDACLFLYPLEEWKQVEEQLSSLSSIRDKHRNFIRSIVRYANYVQYDSQGRIQIPDNLLKYANIDKKVMVIGVIKKIELWDQDTLDKYENTKDNFTEDDFDELAQEINF